MYKDEEYIYITDTSDNCMKIHHNNAINGINAMQPTYRVPKTYL